MLENTNMFIQTLKYFLLLSSVATVNATAKELKNQTTDSGYSATIQSLIMQLTHPVM